MSTEVEVISAFRTAREDALRLLLERTVACSFAVAVTLFLEAFLESDDVFKHMSSGFFIRPGGLVEDHISVGVKLHEGRCYSGSGFPL